MRWSAPALFGTLERLPASASGRTAALRGELIGNAAAGCDGTFGSRTGAETGRIAIRLTATCTRETGEAVSEFALFPTRSGPLLLSADAPGPAAPLAARLVEAAAGRVADLR